MISGFQILIQRIYFYSKKVRKKRTEEHGKELKYVGIKQALKKDEITTG